MHYSCINIVIYNVLDWIDFFGNEYTIFRVPIMVNCEKLPMQCQVIGLWLVDCSFFSYLVGYIFFSFLNFLDSNWSSASNWALIAWWWGWSNLATWLIHFGTVLFTGFGGFVDVGVGGTWGGCWVGIVKGKMVKVMMSWIWISFGEKFVISRDLVINQS